MDGLDLDRLPSHPARDAARRSVSLIEAGDRDGWLAIFADDAIVEDPIGPSMFDPDGQGHRGRDAIGAFYDNVISMADVRFSIRESYAGGLECANVGTITTTLPDGTKAIVDGVFTYRIDDAGQVVALRAYWETDALRLVSPRSVP